MSLIPNTGSYCLMFDVAYFLSDFNHVYSNIGYVMLGGLFMVFTWRRQGDSSHPPFTFIHNKQ
jgi:hypothetical protein